MLIHQLTAAQCEEVLERTVVARLACVRAGQPYIVPISLAFDAEDRSLVSFSTVGRKVEWMRANPSVCVEAEEIVDRLHWTTVLVTGRYHEVLPTDTARLQRIKQLLESRQSWWLPGAAEIPERAVHDTPLFYRIVIREMSGRRAGG